jgi:uncharacterized LabA/DUF88 family protein
MGISGGGGMRTDLKRWMLFVDGENFVMRAQEFLQGHGLGLEEGKYYNRDVFVWFPDHPGTLQWPYASSKLPLELYAVRSYYYTSVTGDDKLIEQVREQLWSLDFQPEVFKRTSKGVKAKGVDIALTKDMLTHAFFNHYDAAVLMSGDGDYVPLVDEVKRLGKIVCVAAFSSSGLSLALRLSSDAFVDLEAPFKDRWSAYSKRPPSRRP